MAKKTPYAKQFGSAPAWLGLGRDHSGLSPVDPRPPLLPSQLDIPRKTRKAIEKYQRDCLRGFTTQMLIDIDAITNRELKANDLNSPLHPLVERSRWATLPQMYLTSLAPNYIPSPTEIWSASIDSVWNAMLPSLRLLSILLRKLCDHPWVCHDFDTSDHLTD